MAAKVLNIEVCDQTITVCRTARKGKGVRIFESFVFPTPEDCVADGAILHPTILAIELKKQLSDHGIQKAKTVIFSISSNKIAVREVKLPPMKEKLIAAAIKTNSEEYFPIDLENYHITYSILDTASSTNPYSRILVMAAPVSIIEGYVLLAEKAGLSIKAIDSSGNSQYQALKCIDHKNVSVYVDVGSASSIISFMREGKLLLQRTFAFGADELISHYMNVSGKTRENYLEVLNETNVTHPDFAANKLLSLNDIQSDLERLTGGIIRSIDYFNSSQWDSAVTRVVLVGLNRHIVGLKELVADATGLKTLYLDEIAEFTAFANGAADAPTYINCIGSSLDPLDLISTQFLPSRKNAAEDENASIVPGLVVFGLIVAAAIIVSLSSWLGYASSASDLKAVQTEISSYAFAQQTYDSYIAYQSGEQAISALNAQTTSPNAELVAFFGELEKKMPSSILLLSASCSSESISLNITVGSYTDAATVISSLRSFSSLDKVEVSDLTSEENEVGEMRISFTVNCVYGANPYTNNINPYNELFDSSNEATGAAADTTTGTTTEAVTVTESATPAQ